MTGRIGMTRMRVMMAVAGLLLAAGSIWAMEPLQQKDDLFAGADKFSQGAKSSTEVNLDKNMLGLMGKFGDEGEDKSGSELAKRMDFVIVRSYEYAEEGRYNIADVEQFRKRLEDGGWSHVVKERGERENTDVCVKLGPNGEFSELVVISAEPKELTFVHLKGHMSAEDLMKVSTHYGVREGTQKAKDKEKDKEKMK
ncbi:MAG TPA: DUF4252 domain-containing protein [Edaphobacter sp.]|nr:DUF4252 domain-containing protein [Edaphobacter sp.]